MKQFRDDNTEGFSTDELEMMNTVFARLENWFPGTDQKNIIDAINNAYEYEIREDELYNRAARSLTS